MIDALERFLGEPFEHRSGNEVRFNCIYCESRGRSRDIKYHFYINKSNGLFFCQRCEAKGHISFFLKNSDFMLTSCESPRSRVRSLLDSFEAKTEESNSISTADLPDDYMPIMEFPGSQAARYLNDRGISTELAIQRGIGFGIGRNQGRIILPVFDPNDVSKCIYWVGRSYTNTGHLDNCKCYLCRRKYSNPKGVNRRFFLYGLEFCNGDECCITEGALSALSSGPNSLGTFGKHVTDEQLDLICDRFDRIQVALDSDAYDRSYHLVNKLLGRKKYVEYIPLPNGRDPNDIGEEGMLELRGNGIPISRANISLIMLGVL